MRTFVATYKLHIPYSLERYFDVPLNRAIKYKFDEDTISENTICYVTIVAHNRLELRKYKQEVKKVLKGFDKKVELIIGIG